MSEIPESEKMDESHGALPNDWNEEGDMDMPFDWDDQIEVEEMALDILESCPPDVHHMQYLQDLKNEAIAKAKEEVEFNKRVANINGSQDPAGTQQGGGGSGISSSSRIGISASESGSSRNKNWRRNFDAERQLFEGKPLVYTKLINTVKSLSVLIRETELNRQNRDFKRDTKKTLSHEGLYFLRALTSGIVEAIEYTYGSTEERKLRIRPKYMAIPEDLKSYVLDACTCMVRALRACQKKPDFDSKMGGVDYMVDFLVEYFTVNREDCVTGRYTLDFVREMIVRLKEDTVQRLFLERLSGSLKSNLNMFNLSMKRRGNKGVIGSKRIDALFCHFELLEALVYDLRIIDEEALMKLKGIERVSASALAAYPLIQVYAARIAVRAEFVFNKKEITPAKRKYGDLEETLQNRYYF